ncbi:MAG: aldehyde dehydrogenase family protein, partial [bacterium]
EREGVPRRGGAEEPAPDRVEVLPRPLEDPPAERGGARDEGPLRLDPPGGDAGKERLRPEEELGGAGRGQEEARAGRAVAAELDREEEEEGGREGGLHGDSLDDGAQDRGRGGGPRRVPALRKEAEDGPRTEPTGDGRRGTDMGPLVTGVHRDKVKSYVDAGAAAGATLVVDGRDIDVDGDEGGFWLLPTLFDHVTTDMTIYTDEIFGPVLSVVRVPSYEAGVQLINDHPYGNGTAIFTNDGGAARRFQNEVEVGMIGINVPIPVPVAYYSFGGWKASLFGDTHAHGMTMTIP